MLAALHEEHDPGRRKILQADEINLTYGVLEGTGGIDTGCTRHRELIGRKPII